MVMSEVNKACEDMVNYNADGTVNWDYVDADAYMAIAADDPVTKEMLNQYNAAFNRYVDLINANTLNNIFGKLDEFKKKVKSKYEVISVFSEKDIQKVKKLLIKNAN